MGESVKGVKSYWIVKQIEPFRFQSSIFVIHQIFMGATFLLFIQIEISASHSSIIQAV